MTFGMGIQAVTDQTSPVNQTVEQDDRKAGSQSGGKSDSAYRTISEVAQDLNLPQHVLRFWESKFKQISPLKRGGGRRYYRPQDIDLIRRIHHLLHTQGYTIKGVQKLLIKDRQLTGSVESSAAVISDIAPRELHPVVKEIAVSASTPASVAPVANQTDLQIILKRLKALRAAIQ